MAEQKQPTTSSAVTRSSRVMAEAIAMAVERGEDYRGKVVGKGEEALTYLTSINQLAFMRNGDILPMEVEVTASPFYKPVKAIKPNKQLTDALGKQFFKLKQMISLPRVYQWITYEHLYSDIDMALFSGDNEFQSAMKKFVPELCGENLTRMEWNEVRSVIECGRPRRFSSKFLSEAREELYYRRNKIRIVQQGKEFEWMHRTCMALPDEIPAHYKIGTIVTARLFNPEHGVYLYPGKVVEAANTENNTYKVHVFVLDEVLEIPDTDLKATGPVRMISKLDVGFALPEFKYLTTAGEVASVLGIHETPLAPRQTVSVGVGNMQENSIELPSL